MKQEKTQLNCRFLWKVLACSCVKFSKNCYFLACHNYPLIVTPLFHVCLRPATHCLFAQTLLWILLLLTFCLSGANLPHCSFSVFACCDRGPRVGLDVGSKQHSDCARVRNPKFLQG